MNLIQKLLLFVLYGITGALEIAFYSLVLANNRESQELIKGFSMFHFGALVFAALIGNWKKHNKLGWAIYILFLPMPALMTVITDMLKTDKPGIQEKVSKKRKKRNSHDI